MSDPSRPAPKVVPGPHEVDATRPSAARAYDYYLGGSSNFEVDRKFAEEVLRRVPFVRDFAHNNRAFLRRAVTWLCGQGIDQFLDIGSGIPTVGNVHEIAQELNPNARVVYVDYEPVAAAHAHNILDQTDPRRARTNIVQADLRRPWDILDAAIVRDLIDFTRPVGLLIVATLHFASPDDRPRELLAQYRAALPPGSHIALSHLTVDGVPDSVREQGEALEKLYASTPTPGYFRDRAQFEELFDGFDLVEPGVVWAPQWHPDETEHTDPAGTATLVGVGRKP
jgi:hypothetical protein